MSVASVLAQLRKNGALTGIGSSQPSASFPSNARAFDTPLFVNKPNNIKEFNNKWSSLNLQGLAHNAVQTVYQTDRARLGAGGKPFDKDTTIRALQAAQQGHPITTGNPDDPYSTKPPEPSSSPWNILNPSSWLHDAQELGAGILNIIPAIGEAVLHPEKSVQGVEHALQTGKYGEIFDPSRTPIGGAIPGATIASALLPGGRNPKYLLQHPLYTALDLLPYLEKGAELTPVGKFVAEHAEQEVRPVRPLTALITKKIQETPIEVTPLGESTPVTSVTRELVPNRFGETLADFNRANNTFLSSKFGPLARRIVQPARRYESGVVVAKDTKSPIPESLNVHGEGDLLRRANQDLLHKYNKLVTPAQRVEIANYHEDPINSGVDPSHWTDNMKAYYQEATDIQHMWDRSAVPIESILGNNDLLESTPIARWRGDIYTTKKAAELATQERKFADSQTRHQGELIKQITNTMKTPGSDPRLQELLDSIGNGQWGQARNQWAALTNRRVNVGVGAQRATLFKEVIDENGNITYKPNPNPDAGTLFEPGGSMSLKQTKNIANKLELLERRQNKFENTVASTPPAAFGGWIMNKVGDRVIAHLSEDAKNNPELAAKLPADLAARVMDREYGYLVQNGLISQDVLNSIANDVARGWQDARRYAEETGTPEPGYIHHIAANQARTFNWPRILPKDVAETSARERTWSFQPYVKDMGMALTHGAMERMVRQGQLQYIDDFLNISGATPTKVLFERYYNDALRHGKDFPSVMNEDAINLYLDKKGWAKFDPKSFLGYQPQRFIDLKGEDLWVPKSAMKVLEEMRAPVTFPLEKFTEVPMAVFRTSVLTTSIRWLANNVLGGAMMTGAITGPTAFSPARLKAAWELSRRGETAGGYRAPDELLESMGQIKRETKALNWITGNTMRRWLDKAQENPITGNIARAGSWYTDKVLNANIMFDDLYRSVAYLYGHDKALTKGLSEELAAKKGLALVERALPQWEALTPFERSIVRSVFPFYTWTQHIIRYVYNLPLDHPTRVAVTSALVRSEMKDEQSGWPLFFRSMVGLGDNPDHQLQFKLGGGNPFQDAFNLFQLQGFLRSANPFIQIGMRQLGIDPKTGTVDAYPDIEYDPATGGLKYKSGNSIGDIFKSFIPQLDTIMALVGRNHDFNAMYNRDPQAAMNRLLAGLGIPTYWQHTNVRQEAAKAEVKNFQQMVKDRQNALRNGDLGLAAKWRGNEAWIKYLRSLTPQQLQQFEANPVTGDTVRKALVGAVNPGS